MLKPGQSEWHWHVTMECCNLNAEAPPIKAPILSTEITNSIQSTTGKYFAVRDLANMLCSFLISQSLSHSLPLSSKGLNTLLSTGYPLVPKTAMPLHMTCTDEILTASNFLQEHRNDITFIRSPPKRSIWHTCWRHTDILERTRKTGWAVAHTQYKVLPPWLNS